MKTGHGAKQNRKWEQAISALLREPSVKAAAGEAGVAERTLRLWLKDIDFKAAYRAARMELVEATLAHLLRSCVGAVAALNRGLKCGDTPAEIKAAVAILGHAFKGVESFDLVDRVAAIEQQLEATNSDGSTSGQRLDDYRKRYPPSDGKGVA